MRKPLAELDVEQRTELLFLVDLGLALCAADLILTLARLAGGLI
jgi:hypothetical protein